MKNLFIMCVVTALASAVSVCASGQTTCHSERSEESALSLHDCMAYAISHSTKVRIQQAAIGDAQIDRRDAALALFTPQINAQTVAYYNFGRNIDPETNVYIQTTSFHNSYGVSAGYDLFDGFKAVNNWKISKTGLLIAESQEKQVEADICLAVMEAYYNVVYYKRLTDVYEEQVATAEQALKKAQRQEELGQKGHADVIQMESDLADRQYDLTNTFNKYVSEKMKLADLMFWPVEEELTIVTDYSSVIPSEVEESPESVVDFALDHNPGVNMASWKELNAKRELSTAKWQLMPSIGLYGGWNTNYFTYPNQATDSFGTQFRNNMGEYVQLSLSIPIWDRLAKASRISKKRHALEKATAELDQKRRDVESEVRRAIQDRDGSATAYRQAVHKADVQNEAYTLNLKKLEQGLISPLEFQTASNNFLKAQADEMNSLFKYLIKQAVVRYYNGVEYVNQ